MTCDFLIAGAGIFGITTAIELARRRYSVCVMDPGPIPHPLAESNDISKVVRMEYGADEEYMKMAAASIDGWKAWNELFGQSLYHETGYLVLTREKLESAPSSYASTSYAGLLKRGYRPQRLDAEMIGRNFPAFNHRVYTDGFYHAIGGYALAGKTIEELTCYAAQLGVDILEGQTAGTLMIDHHVCKGVKTREGRQLDAGHVIVCAGNMTPYLLPELLPYMHITGQPVFHLKPVDPALFAPSGFPVFTADIQATGWYGFPYHSVAGVVKVANHGIGIRIHPEKDERIVTAEQVAHLRGFLAESIPPLAGAGIVYTRLCCYTDTLDGHFWIDRHPAISGLTVASGGSGHAFKMGPVLGEMIADTAEGKKHRWSSRYGWRVLGDETKSEEEARMKDSR